ncbi:mycothiol acetyltransferase-like isoform X1 [Pocillopora verrucosa]|uniref:mycothiol acetyltransferase-like isoform X1 n=1 Tax=Pocillopora verrucosa TaxID=203993 RepID=UPI00333E9999
MREDQCRLIFCNLQEKSIPEVRLSSDFVICTWKNGDEHRWIQIVKEAFGEFVSDWSAERFVERYASSPLFKEDGFFFIRHNKRYVATAFAWQDKLNSLEGRLHWLAVLPEYHRQGLGRALALRVLLYHKDHGKESVSLITEVYRHSALKLYKDIGFVCSAEET